MAVNRVGAPDRRTAETIGGTGILALPSQTYPARSGVIQTGHRNSERLSKAMLPPFQENRTCKALPPPSPSSSPDQRGNSYLISSVLSHEAIA